MMEQHTYEVLYNTAREALADRRLGDALQSAGGLAAAGEFGEYADTLSGIREAYGMMLDYMERGSADPERESMYAGFLRRTGEVLDRLGRDWELRAGKSVYAVTRRTVEQLGETDWTALLARLEDNMEALAAYRAARPDEQASARFRSLTEAHVNLYRLLYEVLFTAAPWTAPEAEAAAAFMASEQAGWRDKCLLVSAVTVGLLHVFDVRRLLFLYDCSAASSVPVRVRGQVGAALCHVRHAARLSLYPEVEARLTLLADEPGMRTELLTMQLQLLMSLETKKIEKNLREEILPEMMRGASAAKPGKQLGLDEATARFQELAINPEWGKDERLERFERKMQELAEMQARGADVFMGSFSVLKQRFPFFEVAANWFYPFDDNHPALGDTLTRLPFARSFLTNNGLCNSDKYSFCLMLGMMPAESSRAVGEQLSEALDSHGYSMADLAARPEPSPEEARRMYIQDLYRFFKLCRHREPADDPFRLNLLLTACPPFDRLFAADDAQAQLAAFLLREKSYAQALPFYEELARRHPEAEWFQKAGYCRQALCQYAEAADAYEKAALLQPGSRWTLDRLATCYRRLDRWADALSCYAELLEKSAEDTRLLLLAADCCIRLERYDEAFEKLYKADYLDHESGVALRALAWCSLLTGKTEQAARYYGQIVDGKPTAADYLNAGHAAWLRGEALTAEELYRLSLRAAGKELAPADFFAEDAEVLLKLGKTETDLRLMLDLVNRAADRS